MLTACPSRRRVADIEARTIVGRQGGKSHPTPAGQATRPPFLRHHRGRFRLALHSTGLAQRINDRLELASADGAGAIREAAAQIRSWVQEVAPPQELQDAIRDAHEAAMPADALLAVRSSVVGEDAAEQSFAGMHDSILCVIGFDSVLGAVKQVWASAYNERAWSIVAIKVSPWPASPLP